MSGKCRYVLPNTSEMNRGGRGGLSERLQRAASIGCELVEVPADFVKNKTEIRLTDLPIGSFLDVRAISRIYRLGPIAASCQVVFHTEPELKLDGALRWYDPDWVDSFVEMQIALAEHFGLPPAAIEIHPGTKPNTPSDVLGGALALIEAFGTRFPLCQHD